MVHLSCGLLWQRWRICSAFDPFLGLLGIWAIPSDVPFVFSMEETILPSLLLVLVSIPDPTLAISLAFGLFSEACYLGLPSLVAAPTGCFLVVLC